MRNYMFRIKMQLNCLQWFLTKSMQSLKKKKKRTCNMNRNLARSKTSLIGDFTCIGSTIWAGSTLYHHNSQVAFEGYIKFVRAKDFFFVLIPIYNHGLWSSNTCLNLHQLALSFLKSCWRLFGKAWWYFLF